MSNEPERPFRILGMQQVAIGGPDLGPLRHLWGDLFGIPAIGQFRSESENVVEDILEIGTGPATVEIDLMQPLDPDGRPKVDAPPLNHIGLWVDDLPRAVTWLTEQGLRFTPGGIRAGASGHDVCFVHPKGNDEFPHGGQGVLIELVQAPAELLDQLG